MSNFYKFSGGGRGGTGRGGGRGRGRFSNTKSTAPSSSKNFLPNPNATHLLIVESPSKCPKISEYLGDQFHCIASKGHIRELISLANAYSSTKTGFETKYTLCPDKIDHVEKMRQTITRFPPQNIILATDDDREGEAIAWHICQVFNLPVETTHRIIFHSITYESILEAVKHPRTIDMNLVHAQQTRQILDVIVGFKISPFLWRHVGNPSKSQSLSAGRCQTPALRLVYDAHLVAASQKSPEIGGNLQEEIGKYKIRAYFLTMNLEFNTDTTFATGKQVQEFLKSSLPDNVHHLLPIEKSKDYSQAPPAPFHTSHLLQVANNKLGLSPKLTMTLCQQLYQEGHITYMRTDSKTYSPEFQSQVQEFIQQKYGANYVSGGASGLSAKTSMAKKGGVAPQEAHEAIRPTHIETMGYLSTANSGNHGDDDADDAPELKGDTAAVKGKKQALYQLIWRNTIESCMQPCRGQRTKVRIQGPPVSGGEEGLQGGLEKGREKKGATENIIYTHDIEVPHFPGWKRVQQWSDAEFKSLQKKQEGIVQYVSHMKPQTPLTPNRIEAEYTEPRPPYYYTESSLIEKLESMGIGRPSTFAMLVDTIQERGYVKKQDLEGRLVNYTDYICIPNPQPPQTVIQAVPKQKKFGAQKGKLVIQPLGISALDFLIPSFSRLFDYEYTSQMESQLDEIARGEKALGVLEKDCYEEIKTLSKPLLDKEKETYSILGNKEYQVAYGKSGPVVFRLIPTSVSEASEKLGEVEEEASEKLVEKKEEETAEDPEVPLKKTRKTKTPKPPKIPKPPKPPKMEKEYLPMRKNLKLDKEKLIQGQYTLEELVEWTDPILGIHEGESMILKSGKFGAYVEWGEKRESITPLVEQRKKQGLDSHDLEASDVVAFLREKEANGGAVVDGKKILRVFTPEISVRMGRYGPYVFYQSSTAPPNTKPQFLSLKKLEVGYLTCSKIQFLKWLADNHGVTG